MNLKQKFLPIKNTDHRIHYKDHPSRIKIIKSIERYLPESMDTPIVIVCIGTDRSTGDALGPLIGTRLREKKMSDVEVFGTLENPVHAVNLEETMTEIKGIYQKPFIIGIDACLGNYNQIGMITVGEGPVLPGAGVNKKLNPVGDMHLTGIVNVSGHMEYFVLQNTRLNLVMNMAYVIADSIHAALSNYKRKEFTTKINIK
ncbi:putative sporulation protein YyaC [Scopulibacillus darangshiensis]|uniref:Putative sporulation protein YyaC n=1 Tax=Scopulibacillus darangshiensis TaxID=442528 RepID=A0A4R2NFI7_9BACL|nr:spore protease YyaC [Scopulibacillus darangshiensis]TCP20020.1 putative sporulation protein YyaC [Scopulibacillus darangshiensis]